MSHSLGWIGETGVSSGDLLHLGLHLLLQKGDQIRQTDKVCFASLAAGSEYHLFLWSCRCMLVRMELLCLQLCFDIESD